MKAAKATIILFIYGVFLCLAMPGISFLKTGFLRTERQKSSFDAKHGTVATELAAAAANLNRARKPIARKLGRFQPLFRIRQSWHLYRDGPRKIRRMEVQVDGKAIYRTGDDSLDWNVSVFRHRRIRPMAETFAKKQNATNPMGLVRHIVNEARADFPDAKEIQVRALWGSRKKMGSLHHRVIAKAPDWSLERLP